MLIILRRFDKNLEKMETIMRQKTPITVNVFINDSIWEFTLVNECNCAQSEANVYEK